MAKKRKRSAPPIERASPSETPPSPPNPDAVDLRFWAAYVLGHHSRTVRLWQEVYWRQPGEEWDTWEGVPLTIDQMVEARLYFAATMPANVLTELAVTFAAIRTINSEIRKSWR